MDRFSKRRAILVLLLGLAGSWSLVGCRSALETGYILLYGTDVDADYPGLQKKKVVVVCRPLMALQYWNANVAKELGVEVSLLLRDKVKKIEMADPRKLSKWLDENNWEEYTAVGKAMNADMVVGIDLEGFNIFQGQTLYQGNAKVSVHVYDCKAGGKEVFTRNMPPNIYPPNAGIPTSDRQEGQFRREFTLVLASQIARHFYPHDPHADLALDNAALRP
jgi:hypothetical protein